MKLFLSVVLFSAFAAMRAQSLVPTETESVLIIKLSNKNGGVFGNMKVTITGKRAEKIAEGRSSASGVFEALVPPNALYNIIVSNYPEVQVVKIPAGGYSKKTLTLIYEADAVAKQKEWGLTRSEEEQVNNWADKLPLITTFNPTTNSTLAPTDFQILYTLVVSDLREKPLVGEKVILHGNRRNKEFVGNTGLDGMIRMLIPKGDRYNVNFIYDSCFSSFEVPFSKGTATRDFTLQYIGTKEIERLNKLEAERVKTEELRLKKAEEEFTAQCKKLGITKEEGRRRELFGTPETFDTVVLSIFNRNKNWKQKLIVCDLTGSMAPYSSQVLLWYNMNYKVEQNLQFVFFNDGDGKADDTKVIGSTGGIYYTPSEGYDKLLQTMAKVAAAGSGGDCAENNMEALINGIKMAKEPYKEIVMIADNNAPVKDIELLKGFHAPVHILVCGSTGAIHPDYLRIAWATKGSVHTMEEDILDIAKMLDGEIITIGVYKYRLQNGKFYNLNQL